MAVAAAAAASEWSQNQIHHSTHKANLTTNREPSDVLLFLDLLSCLSLPG